MAQAHAASGDIIDVRPPGVTLHEHVSTAFCGRWAAGQVTHRAAGEPHALQASADSTARLTIGLVLQ